MNETETLINKLKQQGLECSSCHGLGGDISYNELPCTACGGSGESSVVDEIRCALERQEGCKWSRDEYTDSWDTQCGGKWQFTDGGPVENKCDYCPYCGGLLYIDGVEQCLRMLAAAHEPGENDDER